MKRLALILFVTFLACSCNDDRFASAFAARDQIRLQVGGVEQISYDPIDCQLGFNPDKREFRVHTDNMSDYFTVTLTRIPTEDEEVVSGTLTYTTSSDVITRKNITLEVIRLEGDKIWLWNQPGRIGLQIQVLE